MFPLSKDQQALVQKASAFADQHREFLLPGGKGVKRAGNIYGTFAKAGYPALLIPKEFHGKGLDYVSAGLVYETLSYHLPGTLHGPATTAHCAEMMRIGLQGDVASRHLTAIARDGRAAGFCLTEEGAGSDISSIATTVQKTADGFEITGKKSIVINHAIASYLIVFATSSPAKGRAGLNAFLVNTSLPGITAGDAYDSPESSPSIMGEVTFNRVSVPNEALLGEEGSGYFLLMETLDKGRPLVAACCTGMAKKVFDMVLGHVKNRSQFGRPLFSFQGVSFPLAEFATRIRASRLLAFDALSRIDKQSSFSMEASMAKLHASTTLLDIASFGIETLGHRSAMESHEIRRIHRDAQLMMSIDGTSNVQRMVIASQL